MKRLLAIILFIHMLIFNASLFTAFAEEKTKTPVKPYEKVVAESGSWYTERVGFENSAELITVHTGEYKIDKTLLTEKLAPMEFSVKEKTVLKGIYLPYINSSKEPVEIKLTDEKGNIYGPFSAQVAPANIAVERSVPPSKDEQNFKDCVNYVLTPEYEVYLPVGKFTLTASNQELQVRTRVSSASGAFLIKGVNYYANEKYKKDLALFDIKNDKKRSQDDLKKEKLGNEEFAKKNLEKLPFEKFETPTEKSPAVFTIAQDRLISEIIINTFNEGKGATPGSISILDNQGVVIATFQASGGTLGEVANGAWGVSPDLVLPAGTYYVGMSDPSVISYDKLGKPQFYVTTSPPPIENYDFTGTYKINLDAFKTSTLMGLVKDQTSSFSLKDFELVVIDKDKRLELIGRYENIPFSQDCKIIEHTEDRLVAAFEFAADLTKLPYNAKIGASLVVTLTKPKIDMAKIEINGSGSYQRQASKEKGADFNTYAIKSSGVMVREELPLFVMTALGQYGGAGNVPGPDGSAQATTGLLFPPLVGLVVYVLQNLIKAKEKEKQKDKIKKYSKAWYMQNNPGLTEEQIAMAMLQDALSNTDEPDDDPESIGDNEKPGGSDYVPPNDEGSKPPIDDSPIDEPIIPEEPKIPDEKIEEPKVKEPEVKEPEVKEPSKENTETKPIEAILPLEPETLTLQVDHTGRMVTYVKDVVTGQFVNPDTGGTLDMQTYENIVKPEFEKSKAFIETQRDKIEKGDTDFDRESRKIEQERREAIAKKKISDKLMQKYGTDDRDEIKKFNDRENEYAAKSKAIWTNVGNVAGVFETGFEIIGNVSDVAIDGLATVTGPLGKGIKATYKITKSMTTSGTEAYVDGKSVGGAVASGFVTGATDAATDYVEDFTKNKYLAKVAKAGLTIGGETAGGAIKNFGDAKPGEGLSDAWKGAKSGAYDGVVKVGIGEVSDKVGGDGFGNEMSQTMLKNGKVRIAIKSGDKWVGKVVSSTVADKMMDKKIFKQLRQTATKIGSPYAEKYVIKPVFTDPIKENLLGKD